MKKIGQMFGFVTVMVLFLMSKPLIAEEIQVVVAANFTGAIKVIAQEFEKQSQHHVILIFGSTGKIYAQIKNGAPFQLFLAADVKRPKLLEAEKISVAGSRYTYAQGRIVLWSPKSGFVDGQGAVLKADSFKYLAIAEPKLAPYGMASQEVLEAKGVWSKLQDKIVRGKNISQTYQYVASRNADMGFIAYSQVRKPNAKIEGSYWEIPQALYTPIDQQVVILKDSGAVREFWRYLKSEPAKKIIRSFGYAIPGN